VKSKVVFSVTNININGYAVK